MNVFQTLRSMFVNSAFQWVLICAFSFIALNGIAGGKDSTKAVVYYGNQDFFKDLKESDLVPFHSFLDSIIDLDSIPANLFEQVRILSTIDALDDMEIDKLVDSLLTLQTIPFVLINRANYVLEKRNKIRVALDFDYFIPYDDSEYPANSIYQCWNCSIPNPYKAELSKNDSILTLKLKDEKIHCEYVHPITGVITSKFGYREGRKHNGFDIDLEVWDPIHAAFSGVVRFAKAYGNYGRLVIIRHYNGLETYYAHLHRFNVKVGDIVEAGDVIGKGGSSGRSTGSHLHFEIRFKGIPLNPEHLISFEDEDLISSIVELKYNSKKGNYSVYPKGLKVHTVKRGDYVTLVANRYGLSVAQLCEWNNISRNYKLKVGDQLLICDL